VNVEDRLQRAEDLSRRLEELRARIDTAGPDEVGDLMNELAELGRETQSVLQDTMRAKEETDPQP
jgi:hypothetical protein